jgi:hypothetical protein
MTLFEFTLRRVWWAIDRHTHPLCKQWCQAFFSTELLPTANVSIRGAEKNGTAHFLNTFLLIIEGTTEKVLQFIMPMKAVDSRKISFIRQKCVFEHCWECETKKRLLNDIILVIKHYCSNLFRAAPYMILVALHKDVRFHYLKWNSTLCISLIEQHKLDNNARKQLS